jgi:hypothetical protein
MVRRANIRRLHCATFLRTQKAVDHQASLQPEYQAVVANPVLFRQLLNTVAALMHRYVTVATEHDHIFILVIAAITYNALCIFLCANRTRVGATNATQYLFEFLTITFIFPHFQEYLLVLVVILSLLGLFDMLQEIFLLT